MLTIEPFDDSHLVPAAELFASAYAELRETTPLLPSQYESADEIRSKLADLTGNNPGAVALDGGRLVGYLAGFGAIPHFKGSATGVYMPVWGHTVAGEYDSAAVYQALYTACSKEWVQRQWHTHAITFLQPNAVLTDALYGLGFGLLVIDGMRALEPIPDLPPCLYTIRMATADDCEQIVELDSALRAHLRSAPTFLNMQPLEDDDIVKEFVADDRAMFVAWDGDRAVAAIRGLLNRGDGCDLFDIDGNLGITFGYTIPEARRTGVATQILNELLQWGRDQGMQRCTVDFESANLHARGFWERHFQPICHSAIRHVDDRM